MPLHRAAGPPPNVGPSSPHLRRGQLPASPADSDWKALRPSEPKHLSWSRTWLSSETYTQPHVSPQSLTGWVVLGTFLNVSDFLSLHLNGDSSHVFHTVLMGIERESMSGECFNGLSILVLRKGNRSAIIVAINKAC